jgi:hypothetical protein
VNQDLFAVLWILLPPALVVPVLLTWSSARDAGRRTVPRVLFGIYVVFGILMQLVLGWRYFRAEFGSVAGLLVLYNAIYGAAVLQARRRSPQAPPRLRR